ncbi:MAG: hypothetical protein IKH45_07870, partial [Neisseriaceae bacterium]|nr:hypothetical protein [Neisseriaceae bacterium]
MSTKKAGLYFITSTTSYADITADLVSQAIATSDPDKSVLSAELGYASIATSYAGDVASTAAKSAKGAEEIALKNVAKKLGKVSGGLGLLQVGVNIWDNHQQGKSIEELSAGELLNVAAAVTSMVPGLQIVGFALAGVSVAYSLYEDKNGKITIGELLGSWNTAMDDLVKKFKGDEFAEIKVNIGKLDTKLLDMLPENSPVQKAVMEQFDQWHKAKVLNGVYHGERFFADNEDVLQYTTAMGTGFASASQSNKYIDSFLMDLSSQISKNGDEPLLWTG